MVYNEYGIKINRVSMNYNLKITKFNNINDILIKERIYMNLLLGYCESKMDNSEEAAEIYLIMKEIKKLHEQLFEDVDDIIIELGG